MPYSVTKAAQQHLMKCMANTQGPKVRVNAVLPGLLLTVNSKSPPLGISILLLIRTQEWGLKYPKDQVVAIKERASLKREVSFHHGDVGSCYRVIAC